jgi:hypothetical protein
MVPMSEIDDMPQHLFVKAARALPMFGGGAEAEASCTKIALPPSSTGAVENVCGSLIASTCGSEAARQHLGHRDISTTSAH